jgi:hypothetical protein
MAPSPSAIRLHVDLSLPPPGSRPAEQSKLEAALELPRQALTMAGPTACKNVRLCRLRRLVEKVLMPDAPY